MNNLPVKLARLLPATTKEMLINLSIDDLKQLITDYYANVKLIDLVIKYSLPTDAKLPGAILRSLPTYQSDVACPYDGELMTGKFHAKNSSPHWQPITCEHCSHSQVTEANLGVNERLANCNCTNCQAEKDVLRAQQLAEQRATEIRAANIRAALPTPQNTAFQDLDLSEFIFLVTWVKNYSDPNFNYLFALSTPVLPEDSLATEAHINTISKLNRLDFVGISKTTDLRHISVTDTTYSCNVYEARFTIAGGQEQIRQLMQIDWREEVSIRYHTYEAYSNLLSQLLTIWRDICLQQLMTYMDIQMDKRTMTAPAGEKTKLLLTTLLEKYAPSQIMYFIWCAARNAGDYWAQGHVSKKQASNSIIGAIQRQEESITRQHRDVPAYERPKEFIEDAITRTFFVNVLQLPVDGLHARISLAYLEERFPYALKSLS